IMEYADRLREKDEKFSDDETDLSIAEMEETLHEAYENILEYADKNSGGIGKSPKFPMPPLHLFINSYTDLTELHEGRQYLRTTLEKMSAGGLFDVIGGGFARYSMDKEWRVPHFEKMLYDNAQMLSLYAQSAKHFPEASYVIDKIMFFLEREMKDQQGGYYAAIDADTESGEGDYYVWTQAEINNILTPEMSTAFCNHFQITNEGNWVEGKNILYNVNGTIFPFEKEVFPLLLAARIKRKLPVTDTKIITSWNALLAEGMISAGSVTGNSAYLNAGVDLLEFLLKKRMGSDGQITRISYANKVIQGMPEDYAFLGHALLKGYYATGNLTYLKNAELILSAFLKRFKLDGTSLFGGTDYTDLKIKAEPEVHDLVMPSVNSVICEVLLDISLLSGNTEYLNMGHAMLAEVLPELQTVPANFGNWLRILIKFMNPLKVDVPEKTDPVMIRSWMMDFPDIVVSYRSRNNSFSLCNSNSCFFTSNEEKKIKDAMFDYHYKSNVK
ncbi:MAG: hypothetical protein CVU05_16065, partial [Bacteroidetes bacterium HGW-Bacteroidetes-21]